MSPTLCTAMILSFMATGPVEHDWPQWRGPQRTGRSAEPGLARDWPKDGPTLVTTIAQRGKGFSSPVVSEGIIYGTGYRDKQELLWAIDATTQKELWATPIQGDGVEVPTDGPRSTPTVAGGRVYALGFAGDLLTADAKTGKPAWRKRFTTELGGKMMSGWGYCESVLVDGETVICTPGGDKA
ncbi:MAG: PQQ-binding-like beta-propeller repeat protein, partial [Gemmataceae bacterium]